MNSYTRLFGQMGLALVVGLATAPAPAVAQDKPDLNEYQELLRKAEAFTRSNT